jgi:hypothetical protein
MTLDLDSLREGWDFEAKLAIGQDGKGQVWLRWIKLNAICGTA